MVTVSTAPGLETTDVVLTLGPHHPSTHGALLLRLDLDGDLIRAAEPLVGYLHRGAEKLFEVRDYRQIIVLANRHDWLSAFANELGVVLAVEGEPQPQHPVGGRVLRTDVEHHVGRREVTGRDDHVARRGAHPGKPTDRYARGSRRTGP